MWFPMRPHTVTAGLALVTGCALLAMSGRVGADVVSVTDVQSPTRYLDLDPRYFVPKSSLLGNGFEYRQELGETTGLRFSQFERLDQQVVNKGFYNYKLNSRLQSHSIAFDWHPFRGAFRASGGFILNNPDMTGVATTTGSYSIGVQINPADVSNFLAKPEVQQFIAAARNLNTSSLA